MILFYLTKIFSFIVSFLKQVFNSGTTGFTITADDTVEPEQEQEQPRKKNRRRKKKRNRSPDPQPHIQVEL